MPDKEPFNYEVLVKRLEGDSELIKQLLDQSIPILKKRIRILSQKAEEKDWVQAENTAHSIKGLARMLSFDQLSADAARIEQMTKKPPDPSIQEQITEIVEAMPAALDRAEQQYLKLREPNQS